VRQTVVGVIVQDETGSVTDLERLIGSAPPDPVLLSDPEAVEALIEGRLGDPFALLGPHPCARGTVVRAFLPPAESVAAIDAGGVVLARLRPLQAPGLFAGVIPAATAYRLRIHWPGGLVQETEDPYSFGLLLGELDIYLLAEGSHLELGRCLGAQPMNIEGVAGVRFAVWAPNARRVSVVGDFNGWDGRRHSDAQTRRGRGLGAVHSAAAGRYPLQI
jgi:1,4-alpha-glucan branching enzyme